jgi:hypothetical protein
LASVTFTNSQQETTLYLTHWIKPLATLSSLLALTELPAVASNAITVPVMIPSSGLVQVTTTCNELHDKEYFHTDAKPFITIQTSFSRENRLTNSVILIFLHPFKSKLERRWKWFETATLTRLAQNIKK